MKNKKLQIGSDNFNQNNIGEDYSDVWLAPPEILEALGKFDLDPCAAKSHPWKTAETMWTIDDDGLSNDWFGRVWCNPPYSDPQPWFKRMVHHGNGIMLTFARTETANFHNYVWDKAGAIFFFDGRLKFYRPTGIKAKHSAGAPSVLIAYGDRNVQDLKKCKLRGKFINLRNQ